MTEEHVFLEVDKLRVAFDTRRDTVEASNRTSTSESRPPRRYSSGPWTISPRLRRTMVCEPMRTQFAPGLL